MTVNTTTQVPFFPTIDEEKVAPEVHLHLRLLYDRIANHYTAIQNQQTQIQQMQAQIAALQKG